MSATCITVIHDGDLRCRAEHPDSGTVIVTDAPKDHHGGGQSFSPSELLSISLGGCVLSIMEIAARSIGRDVAGASAAVTKEMAAAPRRIAAMSVTVRVPGNFDARERAKLEAAAHACPVHRALAVPVTIAFDWLG